METFQSLLNRQLSRALTAAGLPATGEVVPATDPRFGDYQTNAALVLAKQRGQNPRGLGRKSSSTSTSPNGANHRRSPAPVSSILHSNPKPSRCRPRGS
jgi:arginyl-tRNA synthetase